MMQETTERKKCSKKIAPIIITVIVVAYMVSLILLAVGVFFHLGRTSPMESFLTVPFLLIYTFVGGVVIAGILFALHQRLREIDGGEEEAASKY